MQRQLLVLCASLLLLASCKSSKSAKAPTPPVQSRPGLLFPNEGGTSIDEQYVDACTFLMRGDLSAAAENFSQVLQAKPDHHAASYNLARIRLEERDYRNAQSLALAALGAEPDNLWYRRLLIQVYERQGNLRKAEDEQLALIQKSPQTGSDWIQLAMFQQRLGQTAKALGTLDQLHDKIGSSPQSLLLQYQWLFELDRFEEAVKVATLLVDMDPSNPEFQQRRYRALTKIGDEIRSEASLIDWMEADPSSGQVQVLLAESYRRGGREEEAKALMLQAFANPLLDPSWKVRYLELTMESEKDQSSTQRELLAVLQKTHPEEATVTALSARVMLSEQPADSARSILQTALQANPLSFEAWKQLLQLSFANGRYDHLYQDSREAREYFPNQEEVLFYFGVSAAAQAQYAAASRAFEKIALTDPDNKVLLAQALAAHARVLATTDERESAQILLNKALLLAPKDLFVLSHAAWVQALVGNSGNDHLKDARKYHEANGHPAGQALLGFVLWKNGQAQEALKLLTQATDQANVAEWWLLKGRLESVFGKDQEAKSSLKKAVDAGANIDIETYLRNP